MLKRFEKALHVHNWALLSHLEPYKALAPYYSTISEPSFLYPVVDRVEAGPHHIIISKLSRIII